MIIIATGLQSLGRMNRTFCEFLCIFIPQGLCVRSCAYLFHKWISKLIHSQVQHNYNYFFTSLDKINIILVTKNEYCLYNKTCVKWPLSKRPKIGFQDHLLLNAGQKYCRMPHGEHSAKLSTFIKQPFVIKIFVLSIFEWPFYTDFTLYLKTVECETNQLVRLSIQGSLRLEK